MNMCFLMLEVRTTGPHTLYCCLLHTCKLHALQPSHFIGIRSIVKTPPTHPPSSIHVSPLTSIIQLMGVRKLFYDQVLFYDKLIMHFLLIGCLDDGNIGTLRYFKDLINEVSLPWLHGPIMELHDGNMWILLTMVFTCCGWVGGRRWLEHTPWMKKWRIGVMSIVINPRRISKEG